MGEEGEGLEDVELASGVGGADAEIAPSTAYVYYWSTSSNLLKCDCVYLTAINTLSKMTILARPIRWKLKERSRLKVFARRPP